MAEDNRINRIKELTQLLNMAGRSYYADGTELMPNIEYDRLYDELNQLEEATGFRLAVSPTQHVGYEPVSTLPRERHPVPMLSLDKTKSPEALKDWLNGHEGVLSWKLDGITCVLTYEGGRLVRAVTRGNGEIGEVVTANARTFVNLPGEIPFRGRLTIRGEAVISYSDFNRINEEIIGQECTDDGEEADISKASPGGTYKNPRNLCAGSVRQLDPLVTASRHVRLIVFKLVSAEAAEDAAIVPDMGGSFIKSFEWLKQMGFETVDYTSVMPDTVIAAVEDFKERITSYDIPSDGLVLSYEDTAYGESLGSTARFPRSQIAFKWQDEEAETVLRSIDWSGSRTGLINPVAVFDPVELEGTTVSRASVHNLSVMQELRLGIGDRIRVYKANMIIPQISANLTRSGQLPIPESCPVCGGPAVIRHDNSADLLYCGNPVCPAKRVKSFTLMVSRDALNIEGLSEMTLEKLIDEGFIKEYADLFRLERFRNDIAGLEGFGEKSADNLIAAAKKASVTDLYRFVYGLGIPGIGLATAKSICRSLGNKLDGVIHADKEGLLSIRDIGPKLADNYTKYFSDEDNVRKALRLASELTFKEDESASGTGEALERQVFAGKTFCITGEVRRFANRRAAQAVIESLGGRAAGSVSKKTSYLINNDTASTSSKNKKARELGIPVISEEEFIAMLPEDLRPGAM